MPLQNELIGDLLDCSIVSDFVLWYDFKEVYTH